MRKTKITVIIPAYDEESTIAAIVGASKKYCDRVIVIDDGSTDRTAEILSTLRGVDIITHKTNRGKGCALRTGISAAKAGEIIVTLDADLQHLPEDIPKFVAAINNDYNLAAGQRDFENMPTANRLTNKLQKHVAKFFFDIEVDDTTCGFRAAKKEVWDEIMPAHDRFMAEQETLINARRRCLKVKIIPIKTIYNSRTSLINTKSKVRPVVDVVKGISFFIKQLLRRKHEI